MQVYTRRDVFAPPDTSYINQVFQPEHGRERWCDDSQEASVIGCQRPLRTDLVGSSEPCRAHPSLLLTKGCSTLYLASGSLVKLFRLPCISATCSDRPALSTVTLLPSVLFKGDLWLGVSCCETRAVTPGLGSQQGKTLILRHMGK